MVAQRHRQGFTLIELMVALAIAALLLVFGVPSFTTFLRNSEVRSTSESIINGLRAASAEATRQNTRILFTVDGSGNWAFNLVKDPVECKDLEQPPIQRYYGKEAGANTKVATTPDEKVSVCFNGLGRIVNQGVEPSDHIQRIDIASMVCGEARPMRIIVDDPNKQLGLRMCDPDPALVTLNDPRACRDDIPIPSC